MTARGRRVHPSLSAARPSRRISPHPPLWLSRQWPSRENLARCRKLIGKATPAQTVASLGKPRRKPRPLKPPLHKASAQTAAALCAALAISRLAGRALSAAIRHERRHHISDKHRTRTRGVTPSAARCLGSTISFPREASCGHRPFCAVECAFVAQKREKLFVAGALRRSCSRQAAVRLPIAQGRGLSP